MWQHVYSVITLQRGRMFSNHFTANILLSRPVKEFENG